MFISIYIVILISIYIITTLGWYYSIYINTTYIIQGAHCIMKMCRVYAVWVIKQNPSCGLLQNYESVGVLDLGRLALAHFTYVLL